MRFYLLTLLALVSPYALADVKFTAPIAGAQIPAGPVTVTWEDSGVAPALSGLSTYTLVLVVGGQEDAQQVALTTLTTTGLFTAGSSVTGTIPPGLAGSTVNGFFWKIVSVATEGGTVINYSDRFTLTGMTGITPPAFVTAVTALNGVTDGPPTLNQVSNADNAPGGGAADAGAFTIPYNLQTGLTKYAPMQPIPPTKITQKNYTPLYPTSAVIVATTFLGQPSLLTTLTASQTFSVSSMENTAAPVSNPNTAMQKFLNRWKD